MAFALGCCVFLYLTHVSLSQDAGAPTQNRPCNSARPVRLPPSIIDATGQNGPVCPSQNVIDAEILAQKSNVENILQDNCSFNLSYSPPCSCGGDGDWTRVAYLNTSDPDQQCPSNWNLITTPFKGCGRLSANIFSCDSVVYPVNGRTYSSVCGRVNAYQFSLVSAFYPQSNDIEADYVSGVSITHGLPGSRQHIWTFAAAVGDNCTDNIRFLCPCSNVNLNWPYQVPSFIGNDYFCESGHHGAGGSCYGGLTYYPDDPLWDGQNCGPSSTCCELNSPPWFCKTLPQPTSDDLEIRQCHVNGRSSEDTIISLIDIYVK